MFIDTDIQKLITLNEIDVLDFKEILYDLSQYQELAEFIRDVIAIANSAFANGEEKGHIVFGIRDKEKEIIGISEQILYLKQKEREVLKGRSQADINDNNQRKFVRVINEYIEGKGGNLRAQFITSTINEKLIGILNLASSRGPFSVKKAVAIKGLDGRDKGDEISIGDSWLRDGEDKRKITPKEYSNLLDQTKAQRRLLNLRKKKIRDLGVLFSKWQCSLLEIDEGQKTTETLVPRFLSSDFDFRNIYVPWPQVESLFSNNLPSNKNWYLNPIIIEGPNGSGRSSLIRYLAYKRQQEGRLGVPILIEKIPTDANLRDFITFLKYGLSQDVVEGGKGSRHTLLIDLQEKEESLIPFLTEIISTFKDWYIWITCTNDQAVSVKEVLTYRSNQYAIELEINYIDRDENFFLRTLNKVLNENALVLKFMSQKDVLFNNLVSAYLSIKSGFYSHEKISGLSVNELLFLKLVYFFQPISRVEVNFIEVVLGLQPNHMEKMVVENLIYINFSKDRVFDEVFLTNEVNRNNLNLFDEDIVYFLELIDYSFQSIDLGIGTSLFGFQLLKLEVSVNNKNIREKISMLSRKLRGEIFCENCQEYFPRDFRYCPNCGGIADMKNNRIDYTSPLVRAPVPFPNANRVNAGTFKTATKIKDEIIEQLLMRINSTNFKV